MEEYAQMAFSEVDRNTCVEYLMAARILLRLLRPFWRSKDKSRVLERARCKCGGRVVPPRYLKATMHKLENPIQLTVSTEEGKDIIESSRIELLLIRRGDHRPSREEVMMG